MEDCGCVTVTVCIFNRFCHKQCLCYLSPYIQTKHVLTNQSVTNVHSVCGSNVLSEYLCDCIAIITYLHLPSCIFTFSTLLDISCSPVMSVLKVSDVCEKVRDRDKAERNITVATPKSFRKILTWPCCVF